MLNRIFITFFLIFYSFSAKAGIFNPHSFVLDNGMKVYVVENHRSPIVTHMVWYKAGAVDELPGRSGTAHFLEHLMFKNKSQYIATGDFSQEVSRHGGEDNAFTAADYTAYYQTVTKDKLEMVMKLEAERMSYLDVSKDAFEKEKQVILEERRMRTENQPFALMRNRLRYALWFRDRHSVPVIGWERDIKAITYKDVKEFHDSWYTPNNAALVVAGDITAEELKPLAEKYYGVIPSRPLPERNLFAEIPYPAKVEIAMRHANVKERKMLRIYPAPSYKETDGNMVYAAQVLSSYLGEGTTSRLYRNLVVKKKMAVAASTWYSPSTRGFAEFNLFAIPAEGVSKEELSSAIETEINDVLENCLTEEDLANAKSRLIAGLVYMADDPADAANIVGKAVVTERGVDALEDWAENIKAVSMKDIKKAVQYLLGKDNSAATGWIMPIL